MDDDDDDYILEVHYKNEVGWRKGVRAVSQMTDVATVGPRKITFWIGVDPPSDDGIAPHQRSL